MLGVQNTAAGILNTNDDAMTLGTGHNLEPARRLIQHGSLAVLGKVEKNLHQALPVCPNGREARLDIPRDVDALFTQSGLDNDSQFFQQEIRQNQRARGRVGESGAARAPHRFSRVSE